MADFPENELDQAAFDARYEQLRELGRGAYGRVILAKQRSLARLVAEIDAAEKPGGLASALRRHALAAALEGRGAQKNGPRGAKPRRPKSGENI